MNANGRPGDGDGWLFGADADDARQLELFPGVVWRLREPAFPGRRIPGGALIVGSLSVPQVISPPRRPSDIERAAAVARVKAATKAAARRRSELAGAGSKPGEGVIVDMTESAKGKAFQILSAPPPSKIRPR
jgi:hypothetical protein